MHPQLTHISTRPSLSRIGQTKKVTIIKMVSRDTVDEDIYAMQQRKAKMNAAIMDSDTAWNNHTKDDKQVVLQTAVNRFLMSPGPPAVQKKNAPHGDCENV
jgi:hypothetical protein